MRGFPALWRSSIRLRLTVAGVSLAAVIFAVGGTVIITLYSRSLTLSVQHYTAQTATAIAARMVCSKLERTRSQNCPQIQNGC